MGITTFVSGTKAKASEVNANFSNSINELGEIRMFAVSISGAISISTLRTRGWALCDGSTPSSQGISGADITGATPDLSGKFIRGNTSASGATGGADTVDLSHNHGGATSINSGDRLATESGSGSSTGLSHVSGSACKASTQVISSSLSSAQSILPTYYEVVFMMKVKNV